MPRNYYLIAGIVYFCSNLIILFASICESTTQYKLAYPYPPGHTPVVLAKPPRALDLEYFHPHHLDLPPVMKDIPTSPPLPDVTPTQDFSKLGFVYITVLGLADQVVPHTGSWRPLATALNYLVRIAPIVPGLPPLWESSWTLVWAVTEPPVAPKPMPASAPNLPTNHTGKLFGIMYITLTGVIDTIIPAAGLWSWVGKSASINNSLTLETQAKGWDSNPKPKSPQAAGLGDKEAACLCFPGVKPLQAEAKNDGLNGEASQTNRIIATKGEVIKVPNRGNKIPTISFMSLKSTLVANQEPSPETGTGPRPDLVTTTLEQDNQVVNSRFLTNGRTLSLSAILPPLNLSTQIPRAHLSQCPDEPLWKILSLEVGCYIDQRILRSKLITIFE
ncbi:hypothetical protein DSO57_1004715 [Entomophthora muscae]|uniref:Uncharacterized protein n=1 Tax=Entomophthora muscae TaxID=34485 RepID=A0ACC2SX34_9FUNG|nr:hypothetical protein DSO57_1004715 [Entomophthora muscae]